jgi:hypothetical protein
MKLPGNPAENNDELDISDDPILFSLNKELESAMNFTDNHLIIFLGAALAIAYLLEHYLGRSLILFLGGVLCIFGGIGYTIFAVNKGKQRVAAKYGLHCEVCGYIPRASQIMQIAQTELCFQCGNKLNVHKPE